MTIKDKLSQFYLDNRIPEEGGVNDKTFTMAVFCITLTLPNPEFRRKAIHIHDIQHILHNKTTSWKGEAFISGWEISTGIWKNFLLGFLSSWAIGYSLWLYPKEIFKGYKKGLSNIGIIDLDYTKEEFMSMSFEKLKQITTKERKKEMHLLQWVAFLFWCFISELIFLFPLLFILALVIYFIF